MIEQRCDQVKAKYLSNQTNVASVDQMHLPPSPAPSSQSSITCSPKLLDENSNLTLPSSPPSLAGSRTPICKASSYGEVIGSNSLIAEQVK
jgi:hypothetical protein